MVKSCCISSEHIDTEKSYTGESSDIYSFCFSGTVTLPFLLAAFEVDKGYLSKSGINFFIVHQILLKSGSINKVDMTP